MKCVIADAIKLKDHPVAVLDPIPDAATFAPAPDTNRFGVVSKVLIVCAAMMSPAVAEPTVYSHVYCPPMSGVKEYWATVCAEVPEVAATTTVSTLLASVDEVILAPSVALEKVTVEVTSVPFGSRRFQVTGRVVAAAVDALGVI